mmetsp:Transcript_32821/g.37338  ORF Transcript_32821/g.37338 Transcript_32821/m.37338 type:complete len:202 (-) Transcript_32821:193-798(-)|eukprot:CAMPEP_0194160534 /NCGR_PEP_ID=MMETSP0152-20130528/78440_1 /TAXON_ID=1049557 /ORGANISM="Thalassiothrix antarctica, Strain L6-D1" /LENGTH=201 /DNA_ID=CAMNT_0038870233 /DNA_START=51 /DNA_END=656 /DNA_ORIENTATION=+
MTSLHSFLLVSTLLVVVSAFIPARQPVRIAIPLYETEYSKSIPFLTRPEKLDGTMPGDMGFDPMGLSEIQTDLKYARWAELKHGRISMLAILGMVVQSSGIHIPGAAYQVNDPFLAISKVGWEVNVQIFLGIGAVELATFNKHYGEGEPGDLNWLTPNLLEGLSEKELANRKEQEIVHCRLAMTAILGAVVQWLLYGKLGF